MKTVKITPRDMVTWTEEGKGHIQATFNLVWPRDADKYIKQGDFQSNL